MGSVFFGACTSSVGPPPPLLMFTVSIVRGFLPTTYHLGRSFYYFLEWHYHESKLQQLLHLTLITSYNKPRSLVLVTFLRFAGLTSWYYCKRLVCAFVAPRTSLKKAGGPQDAYCRPLTHSLSPYLRWCEWRWCGWAGVNELVWMTVIQMRMKG